MLRLLGFEVGAEGGGGWVPMEAETSSLTVHAVKPSMDAADGQPR